MKTWNDYYENAGDAYQAMHERAVESVAVQIKTALADQWAPLKHAGWSDEDIRTILDQAVRECVSKP